jgi:hypothetical protein
MSLIFGFAPTKCKIFKALKDEQTEKIEIEEITSKGASDMRLKDYGITHESVIFFVPSIEAEFSLISNLKNTVKTILGGATCSVK